MFQIERLNVQLGVMLFIGGFEEDCALLTPDVIGVMSLGDVIWMMQWVKW